MARGPANRKRPREVAGQNRAEGVALEEKAKKAKELREALGKWGHYKPV